VASTSKSYAPAIALIAESRDVQPNWGLLMALGLNVVAWCGIAKLF
jgi:hypothetical protein